MPRTVQKVADLKGLFVYHDKNHGTVYYDIFSKNGYILSTSDVKNYNLGAVFLPLAVIVFYFLTQFGLTTLISAIIAVVLYIVGQVLYRVLFLYKLPCIENYAKVKKDSIVSNFSKSYSKQRLAAITILLSLLFMLTGIYAKTSGYTGSLLYGIIALVVFTFVLFVISLFALIKKMKEEENKK